MTMKKNNQIDSFVETYVQALRDNNAGVFAGAGFSIAAGMVDWKGLLKPIAKDIGLEVEKESDLITLAQFHENERGGRHKINQALITEFNKQAKGTENHRILANLPIRTYWTTNYDKLIENALLEAGKRPDVKITAKGLAVSEPGASAVVYKMHGDVSLPDEAVLTKNDYETYESDRHLFSLALQGDLVSKTLLFIGFSFNDPNLAYILGRIRVLLNENRREHYSLMRRVNKKDFKTIKDYHYAVARQELQVRDLKRYGIIGVLVDSYDEYASVLKRISEKYNMGRVFISGSAASYAPWTENKSQEVVQNISGGLAKNGFTVVSGFGVGVGPYVVNGVLEQLEREVTRELDERLVLRPFPISISDPVQRKKRWRAYRQDILKNAGVAIFVFGNKYDDHGQLIDADGVLEEFNLAIENKMFVVPIGCTGGAAKTLHDMIAADFSRYYDKNYKTDFMALSKAGSAKDIADRTIKFINRLRNDA
ncbi:hypothetical protein DXT88_19420 [Herbaspirillum lusitanum]|uniref:SIR2 family protein n=1 Tax=Herbaspirillum lusitanum TaxID=213312 RepID=UPI0022376405|nr:SIR2 family protein [Herbaspirillum lusitanum]MCW5300347.1 hypothetical protein [Herbaspirillum lusitanum]